jgi:hypothetical protein
MLAESVSYDSHNKQPALPQEHYQAGLFIDTNIF